jgi:hypothetical protein
MKQLDLQRWQEAQKRYHLSPTQVQMARELGLNPQKLGKLVPNRGERWKLPLPRFIEAIYCKRFQRAKPQRVVSLGALWEEEKKRRETKRKRKHATRQEPAAAGV